MLFSSLKKGWTKLLWQREEGGGNNGRCEADGTAIPPSVRPASLGGGGPCMRPASLGCGGTVQHSTSFTRVIPVAVEPPSKQTMTMQSFHGRMRTFEELNWPQQINQSPKNMALAGFFYTGHSDTVECFYCGQQIQSWNTRDVPIEQHIRWNPCSWAKANRSSLI